MNITILSVDIKTVPTAKGSYSVAEVAFKNNSFQGKVEGKKVMSFGGGAKAFQTLQNAVTGDTFDVEVVKNAQGYNDWVSMVKAAVADAPIGASNSTSKPAARSSYETAEERAQRQVLIVRQSSLGHAVSSLSIGAKTAPKFDDIVALARQFEQYVFGVTGMEGSGFDDMPNDFPDVA